MQNNIRCLILMLALAAGLTTPKAQADGGLFPRRNLWQQERERALINEPAQKAAIFYDGGQERLIISPSYQGPAGDFAWVVPVPARPQVKILKGALFHELERIVEPAPPPMVRGNSQLRSEAKAMARPPVIVLERKTVGAYDVSVLLATDPNALRKWLDTNGYALTPNAERPLAEYVREQWTFVACRVKAPANAHGLQSGTMAPLSLTFPTPRIVYPMRLSAVNPRPFALLLYLLRRPGSASPHLDAWPGTRPPSLRTAHVNLLADAYGTYPTLASLGVPTLDILWLRGTVAPQDCTRDYLWTLGAVPPTYDPRARR
jgi:hypothetical protein